MMDNKSLVDKINASECHGVHLSLVISGARHAAIEMREKCPGLVGIHRAELYERAANKVEALLKVLLDERVL